MAYTPTGITAQARQHPMLARTDDDSARLAAAEDKRRRKAERALALQPPAPMAPRSPPPVVERDADRAEERRLKMRARKL